MSRPSLTTQSSRTVVLPACGLHTRHARATSRRIPATFAGGVAAAFLFLALALTASPARAEGLNACGCSKTESGACVCTKQAKCGCPGMCEPVGCAAKREKEWNKQLEEETRRAEERAAAQRADREAKKRAAEAAARGDDDDDSDSRTESNTASTKKAANKATNTPPPKARHMSPAQEKSLRHLIDVYLAAHPDESNRSLSDVRADLTGG